MHENRKGTTVTLGVSTARLDRRGSGVLMHPTSLPGPPGHGDLGPAARRLADLLASARQSWWQMLPVVPPGACDSPYQSTSAMAGSPWLISPELLAEEGRLDRRDLTGAPAAGGASAEPARSAENAETADYEESARWREPLLREAFARFERSRRSARDHLEPFRRRNRRWLADFALFSALRTRHQEAPWTDWEPALHRREPAALARARRDLAPEIRYHEFLQYQFDRQWSALRDHCRRRGVGLIGDIPLFVSHDSADVWAHQDLFRLDARGRPTQVAGVPPDYFSSTGQLWGNPLYRWDRMRRRGFDWWLLRLESAFRRFDAVRVDHFIGLHRGWEVPAGAGTASEGRYRPGPGAAFLRTVFRRLGPVQLIAEDLGVVTPEVKALRDRFGLPGLRVLQFAFGDDPEAPSYQPHNHPPASVVYTGTHDNDTTVGWFSDPGSEASTRTPEAIRRERAFALAYLGTSGREIHWEMIRLAWMSVARTAIAPAQDLLGLGSRARMNRPGVAEGNWRWRLREGALDEWVARRLREMTTTYGRAGGEDRP